MSHLCSLSCLNLALTFSGDDCILGKTCLKWKENDSLRYRLCPVSELMAKTALAELSSA